MSSSPPVPRTERLDPPEIAALRRLKRESPDLASAADMQIDILVVQRRAQSRLTTPWIESDAARLREWLQRGEPILRFEDLAVDGLAFRVMFRQMTDVLRRFDILDAGDHAALQALARSGHPTQDELRRWFDDRARRLTPTAAPSHAHGESFDQIMELSARPFLERATELLRSRTDVSEWNRSYCVYCGGDPEMASLSVDGRRRLHCGRCAGAWDFDAGTCPHCGNRDARQQASYASADGRYRLLACNACRRYLKALDGRHAERPLMLSVDSIATLPLDAAAIHRGYTS